jgi:glycosyltransferase involved in cell wall biosynthesis
LVIKGQTEGIKVTANQRPERRNYLRRFLRCIVSHGPKARLMRGPSRPNGISVMVRVKDERDWIEASIASLRSLADEILIGDNGSKDGTYELLTTIAEKDKDQVKLWQQPDLDICELSRFLLWQTKFRWIFRWDADMVAHTSGEYDIANLRDRLLKLDPRRYFVIYLRHVNLAGDLLHQDSKEMVHIEEYIYTFSEKVRYVHPGRFEAAKFPKYYRPLFWYEPYGFHVDVKPARRMLLRHFWEEWMELKDYERFPTLEDYVKAMIESEFSTNSWEEAQRICVQRVCSNYIRYDPEIFGPYPDLLKPYLENSKYKLRYENGKIVGRDEF